MVRMKESHRVRVRLVLYSCGDSGAGVVVVGFDVGFGESGWDG